MPNIKSMSWCLKNGVKVGIDATKHTNIKTIPKVKLTVNINGKTTQGTMEYSQDDELINVVTDLYKRLEDKLK